MLHIIDTSKSALPTVPVSAGSLSASGTITSAAGTLNFSDYSGTSRAEPYVTVTGLTFTPKFIEVIKSSAPNGDWTVYDGYENFKDSPYPSPIYDGYSNYYIQLTGNASVTSTGFQLPVGAASVSYKWRAWG